MKLAEKFIITLGRIIDLYLYFIIMACFLSFIPNINVNYPLFNAIFTCAGFYIIPPLWGVSLSPAVIMVALALVSTGLRKIYNKYFRRERPQVIVLSPEKFLEMQQKGLLPPLQKVPEENISNNDNKQHLEQKPDEEDENNDCK